MNTRRLTMKELGIQEQYWISAGVFFVAGVVGCYSIKFEPESKSSLLCIGGAFTLIGTLALLWPLIRMRENQGIRFISEPTKRFPYRGIFVRVSNAKIVVGIIGGFLLCAGALGALHSSWGFNEESVKGILGLAGCAGLFFCFFCNYTRRLPGVLLSKNGVSWNGIFSAPIFIQWDQIARASVYFHQEKHSKSLSLGLAVIVDQLDINPQTRRKMEEHCHRHGWHLRYSAESLLEPLTVVEKAINFYRDNKKERAELETRRGLDRMVAFEHAEDMFQMAGSQS